MRILLALFVLTSFAYPIKLNYGKEVKELQQQNQKLMDELNNIIKNVDTKQFESIAEIGAKMDELTEALNKTNGRIEDLHYRLQTLEQKVDDNNADLQMRIEDIEAELGLSEEKDETPTPETEPETAPAIEQPKLNGQGGIGEANNKAEAELMLAALSPRSVNFKKIKSSEAISKHTPIIEPIIEPAPQPTALPIIKQPVITSEPKPVFEPIKPTKQTPTIIKSSETVVIKKPEPSVPIQPIAKTGEKEQKPLIKKPESKPNDIDEVIRLMRNFEYEKGERLVTGVLRKNQFNDQALYWLAEGFYEQSQYDKAALYYLKVYKTYPYSQYAAPSLYKLGVSLDYANKPQEACQALNEFANRYTQESIIYGYQLNSKIKDLGC